MSAASPLLGARDINAVYALRYLGSSGVTRYRNGVYRAGRERWHTRTSGNEVIGLPLRISQDGPTSEFTKGVSHVSAHAVPRSVSLPKLVLDPLGKVLKHYSFD